MNEIAINVEHLTKEYRIGQTHQHGETMREALLSRLRRGQTANGREATPAMHVALRDVSFAVKRSEVIGVIGRNGAGKSTLLKILSRITEPTSGQATIYGRVGSLLEVGTGFHPELTGRENVFMNGATLGMRRTEIARKFDEIVAFSEVEKFIDTPIKRYSSGMRVRLAFAVAAHLEPEILLVDEVLAVGDAAFQEKCLGKMSDVVDHGRTILFVSHNMASIKHLCSRSILLEEGEIAFDGPSDEAVQRYMVGNEALSTQADNRIFISVTPNPALKHQVLSVEAFGRYGEPLSYVATDDYVRFRITWQSTEAVRRGGVMFGLHTLEGVPLIHYSTQPISKVEVEIQVGLNQIDIEFERLPLAAGQYYVAVVLMRPRVERLYTNNSFGILRITENDVFDSGYPVRSDVSLLTTPHRWLPVEDE
ncbi:MAG: ABC transporter ATP-binding protein [Anaerolineae bacterium]|nr:ABC transporter ATP-binding protein [Anaerolineae bacterium]MCO5192592.1 ABC transporter ATP-binding protein [Anaerolineae bacterium]